MYILADEGVWSFQRGVVKFQQRVLSDFVIVNELRFCKALLLHVHGLLERYQELGLSPLLLHPSYFGYGLCHLLFLKTVDAVLEVLQLQIDFIHFVSQNFFLASHGVLVDIVLLVAEAVDGSLEYVLSADTSLEFPE